MDCVLYLKFCHVTGLIQTLLGAWLGLGTQPYYKAHNELVEIRSLTLGQWGCPLDNCPKLVVGQPSNRWRNKKSFFCKAKKCFIWHVSLILLTFWCWMLYVIFSTNKLKNGEVMGLTPKWRYWWPTQAVHLLSLFTKLVWICCCYIAWRNASYKRMKTSQSMKNPCMFGCLELFRI